MASSPSVSSPFKSVLDTVGPNHEKALKQAFYNTAAILFAVLSLAVGISAYYVLEVFLRPLVWAALCGTFLFPFKKASTKIMRKWLKDLEVHKTPFMLGVSVLPFKGINKSADLLGKVIKDNLKLLSSIFILVPLCYYLVVFHPFYQIFTWINVLADIVVKILILFSNPLAVWTIFGGFVILLVLYKNPFTVNNKVLNNDTILKYISICVWLIMLLHAASLAGAWKVPLALLFIIFIGLGIIGNKKNNLMTGEGTGKESEVLTKKEPSIKKVVDDILCLFGILVSKSTLTSIPNSHGDLSRTSSNADLQEPESLETADIQVEANVEITSKSPLDIMQAPIMNPIVETLKSDPTTPVIARTSLAKKAIDAFKSKKHRNRKRIGKSDPYFIALFWLFAISRAWMHTWLLLEVFPILFVIYTLKWLALNLGIYEMVKVKSQWSVNLMQEFYLERQHVLFPGPIKGVIFMIHTGDQKIIRWMDSALDKLMSVFIILLLGIITLLAAAFFAVQVHHESSYLVTVVTDVVNTTVVSNQDYLKWLNLNDSDVRKTFDSTVHKAYVVGRTKMAGVVSSSLASEGTNISLIEEQLTYYLDQLYESWAGKDGGLKIKNKSNFVEENTNILDRTKGNGTFFQQVWTKVTNFTYGSDVTNLMSIAQENMTTLRSVFDSIWLIVKGNVNLIISIITHIFSIVLSSGTYLLNALISSIIFTTSLFYLLSASKDSYMLVDLFSGVSMGTRLGESIDKAIQDVFGASLKMAVFYGLYTWLTHSVFGANIIFIPAALAAILGVVPFIGTYWAAVPASLELWLIQNNTVLAALLLGLHLLPTYVVDTAIYSEIGGAGHPYLTGLAVAGGVYCIGLEGAFVGPIVLCCLIAAFDIYNGIMNDNGNSDTGNISLPSTLTRFRRTKSVDPQHN